MAENVRTRSRPIQARTGQTPSPQTQEAGSGQRPIRTRTPQAQNGGSGRVTWMHRGADAARMREQEQARATEAREKAQAGLFMPFRFRLNVGDTAEVIILDHEPGPHFYEHDLSFENRVPRKKGGTFEPCPKEIEPCPLCAAFKESYWVMMLTIIDLRQVTRRDNTTIPYTRKLLPVKLQMQPKFTRLFERHGTLRGVHLLMTRDANNQAAIGDPEFLDRHDEIAILESFQHPVVYSQQDPSKIIKAENADCFAFPYDDLFDPPSADRIRQRYRAVLGQFADPPPGSPEADRQEWGRQDIPEASDANQGGGGRIAPRRGERQVSEEDDDIDDEIPF